MAKVLRALLVVGLVLLLTNSVGATTLSGRGAQEIRAAAAFTVDMWCLGAGPTTRNTYPSQQLTFGAAATSAPFARTNFFPAYTDATYGCGQVDELQINTAGYTGRVQAVVKYDLSGSGATAANIQGASLTFDVSDFHRTTNIATDMAIGVYDMQAAQKANGNVNTNTIYPLGTQIDVINVSFTAGQSFTVDVTDAVKADLQAGRTISGFILYPENTRTGLEEVSFTDPVLAINPIPTMTEWGMIVFALLLVGFALWTVKRRRKAL